MKKVYLEFTLKTPKDEDKFLKWFKRTKLKITKYYIKKKGKK